MNLIRNSLLTFLLLLLVGCSSSETASISGKAVCDGSPLPEGLVVFTSKAATCSGKIVDGQYEVFIQDSDGSVQAVYTVTVLPPPQETEYDPSTGEEEPVPSTVDRTLYPQKYRSTVTSGLKFTPEQGENDFDITLTKDAE